MLTSVGRVPLAGRCRSMIVSERPPVMSRPRASWFSCCVVRPPRLSEPAISQFVPAEVNEVGTSTLILVSLELTLK